MFVLGSSACFFAVVSSVGEALRMGTVSFALGAMAASGVGYLLSTAPRRMAGLSAFRQTVEAPSLAASSNIHLMSTQSRNKAFLMVRAEEPSLRLFLADVRRRILLGYDASSAAAGAKPESRVFSESARAVFESVAGAAGERSRVEEGGEELDGILSSSGLDDETKLPLLIAVSFFLPIMLMLLASTSKETGPEAMAALVVLEVVVLDIVLALSSSTVSWGKKG